ncbi:hypothetical protein P4W15_12145 [Morganella morganii]|nr:hypothetical protein [Morganella morganii]
MPKKAAEEKAAELKQKADEAKAAADKKIDELKQDVSGKPADAQ